MSEEKTRNIVGNIPEPDELYGREELIEHLWRQIQGNNIFLLAPRRFGKSGVMRHVLQKPRQGYLPISLDLEDVDSPGEFVWRVTNELLSRNKLRSALQSARQLPGVLGDWVKGTFDEAGFEGAKVKFKDAVEPNWKQTAKRLLLEMEKVDETVIFIFDELPDMLEKFGDETAREFLAWFRSVRLQQRDVLRRYRFIVAGSTGIDLILRRLNAPDKLNDFDRLSVEPIDPQTASQLVQHLANSLEIQLNGERIEQILALIDPPIPYFIHLLFSQLGQLPATKRQPLTAETLDDVYRQRVLGPTCKHYFDHYRQRLSRYGPVLQRSARAVLKALAEAPRTKISTSALYDVYRKARKQGASEEEFPVPSSTRAECTRPSTSLSSPLGAYENKLDVPLSPLPLKQ